MLHSIGVNIRADYVAAVIESDSGCLALVGDIEGAKQVVFQAESAKSIRDKNRTGNHAFVVNGCWNGYVRSNERNKVEHGELTTGKQKAVDVELAILELSDKVAVVIDSADEG